MHVCVCVCVCKHTVIIISKLINPVDERKVVYRALAIEN